MNKRRVRARENCISVANPSHRGIDYGARWAIYISRLETHHQSGDVVVGVVVVVVGIPVSSVHRSAGWWKQDVATKIASCDA